MGDTSVGGVIMGLLLAVLGIAALVGGGMIVMETTFAEDTQREEDYGPMGLFGGSETRRSSVNLAPVIGVVLAAGGIAATITGFVLTSRSFERGKDRAREVDSS
jgi:hypothetical protein